MSKSGWGSLRFPPDKWDIINMTVEKMRREEDNATMSRERAIELLCGDYLAGGRVP